VSHPRRGDEMRFRWLGRRALFVIGVGVAATVAVAGIA
jgi:hypothetical protein